MIATCAPRNLSPADISLLGAFSPGSFGQFSFCHWDCHPCCRPPRNMTSLTGGFAAVSIYRWMDARHLTHWSFLSHGACGKRETPGCSGGPLQQFRSLPGVWWLRLTPGVWRGSRRFGCSLLLGRTFASFFVVHLCFGLSSCFAWAGVSL